MHAFPARQHGETGQPQIGQPVANVACGLLDLVKTETLVRIEVEDHPVGSLHIARPRSPAVEFDGPHLHALEQPLGIVDVEIVFVAAVLFADGNVMHPLAETAAIVFLEEAFLGAALRTSHEADGPIGSEGQHDRCNCRIVIGQLPLGLAAIRKDDPIAAGNFHLRGRRGRGFRLFGFDAGGILVAAQAKKAAVPDIPVRSEFGKGDLGDQLGRNPGNPARARLVCFDGAGLAFDPFQFRGQIIEIVCGKARTDIPLVDEFTTLVLSEQQRGEGPALGRRLLPPDHDEFLPPRAFHLDPGFAATPGIGAVDGL